MLHCPEGEAEITRIWVQATGRPGDFAEEAVPARRQILRTASSSELFRHLGRLAPRRQARPDHARHHAHRDPAHADRIARPFSRLSHLCRPRRHVGRRPSGHGLGGRRRAPHRARRRPPAARTARAMALRRKPAHRPRPARRRNEILRAMVRFQQLSAPTAAKSVEDTAFYRYGRLLSRNEVGTEPDQFAHDAAAWHAACRERAGACPTPCWPPPRTTTSAARMRACAWPC